jgi:hypothetical protein
VVSAGRRGLAEITHVTTDGNHVCLSFGIKAIHVTRYEEGVLTVKYLLKYFIDYFN